MRYDLYTGMAGHPTPKTARVFFSDMRSRRMVGPFADTDNATETLHHVALAAAHGAYQMADILKVQERLAAELEELNNAMDEYGTASSE